MDLNNVLIWLVSLNCIASIIRIMQTWQIGEMKGTIAMNALLFIITIAGIFIMPGDIGLISGALWGLLVLLPWMGGALVYRYELARNYRAARQIATLVRLLHPLDGWMEMPEMLRASELAQNGDMEKAKLILKRFIAASTDAVPRAFLRLCLLIQDWEQLLEALEKVEAHRLNRDPALVLVYIRALGETGNLARMIERYVFFEKTLKKEQIALPRLFLFAFCGRKPMVEQLFLHQLSGFPSSTKFFWLATADIASGYGAQIAPHLQELLERADSTEGIALRRRIEHPLAAAHTVLTEESEEFLDRISEETERERRYDMYTSSGGFRAPMTRALAGLCTVMFLAETVLGGSESLQTLYGLGAVVPAMVVNGAWWRLIAAQFLHYGFLHFAMNMAALLMLGPFVERILGRWRYAALYLISGTVAFLGVVLIAAGNPQDSFRILVGASGAIMGLVGVNAAILLWGVMRERVPIAKTRLFTILAIVGFQIAFDLFTPEVSSAAHGFGFLGGLLLGVVLTPRERHPAGTAATGHDRKSTGSAYVLVVLVLLLLVWSSLIVYKEYRSRPSEVSTLSIHDRVRCGYKEAVEPAIARGEDLNARDEHSLTPLHLAAGYGFTDIINALVRGGADPNADDRGGEKPLHIAAYLGREKAAAALISAGAEVDAVNGDGETPLHYASYMGQNEIVTLLLSRGAEIDKREGRGKTPLHMAARQGKTSTVNLLLKRGADMNAVDESGTTPLLYAIYEGHGKLADLLLARGADTSCLHRRDAHGETPLQKVMKAGDAQTVKWLKKSGVTQ